MFNSQVSISHWFNSSPWLYSLVMVKVTYDTKIIKISGTKLQQDFVSNLLATPVRIVLIAKS